MSLKRNDTQEENEESYFVSMTDIMTGVLFIFIILIVYFALQISIKTQRDTLISISKSAQDARGGIMTQLKKGAEGKGLDLEIDTRNGILRIPEAALFYSSEHELNRQVQIKNISIIANLLAENLECFVWDKNKKIYNKSDKCLKINKGRAFLETIFIEGHSDDDPIGVFGLRGDRNIRTNLRLSARRATNTFELILKKSPILNEFFSPNQNFLFSASAYGDKRPIVVNDSEVRRQRNRRIDIRFIMYIPKNDEELRIWEKVTGGKNIS